MGFASILRAGVGIIDNLTADMQVSVVQEVQTGLNSEGRDTYSATTVTFTAILQRKIRQVQDQNGRQVVSDMQLIIPRDQSASVRDRFTFNGITQVTLSIEGVTDPSTNRPYAPLVILGGE